MKLLKSSSGEDAWQMLDDLYNEEKNFERLLAHLEKIASALDIEYMDGDFPIGEVLRKLEEYKKHYYA